MAVYKYTCDDCKTEHIYNSIDEIDEVCSTCGTSILKENIETYYEVNINTNPSNIGYIEKLNNDGIFEQIEQSIEVPKNTNLSLHARLNSSNTTDKKYIFKNWLLNDNIESTSNNHVFQINSDCNITAEFELKKYTVNVESNNSEYGITKIKYGDNIVEDSITIEAGNSITLIAIPNEGYEFDCWYTSSNSRVSNVDNFIIIPEYDIKYYAKFKEKQIVITLNSEAKTENDKDYPKDSTGTYIIYNDEYQYLLNNSEKQVFVNYGNTVTLPKRDLENYKIEYWKYNNTKIENEDWEDDISENIQIEIKEDCTLTAVWINKNSEDLEIPEENPDIDTTTKYNISIKLYNNLPYGDIYHYNNDNNYVLKIISYNNPEEIVKYNYLTYNDTLILEAVSKSDIEDKEYKFKQWILNGKVVSTNSKHTFTNFTEDAIIEAEFEEVYKEKYTVNVEFNNIEGIAKIVYKENEYNSIDVYNKSSIKLIAIPNEGYEFDGWYLDGNLESTDTNYSIQITSNSTYIAKFKEKEKTYTVNISPVNHYGVSVRIKVNDNNYEQIELSGKTITAIKDNKITFNASIVDNAYGNKFNGWKIVIKDNNNEIISERIESANEYTLIVGNENIEGNYNYNITALFDNNYIYNPIISTNINPENVGIVTIMYDGQDYSDNKIQITNGDTVQLTATPNEGYEFVNWTSQNGSYNTNPITILNITQDLTYTANFELKKYNVIVNSNNSNFGTVSCNNYNPSHGDTVQLTATPNEGYEFVNWSVNGVKVSTENPYTTTINENTEFVANFKTNIPKYNIEISTNSIRSIDTNDWVYIEDSENNKIFNNSGKTGAGIYTLYTGQKIFLCVEDKLPNNYNYLYKFIHWKEGTYILSYSKIYEIPVNSNNKYIAIFKKILYNINLNQNTNGYITCDSNNISYNNTITLNATPNAGYKFVQWKLNNEIISDSKNCQNYQFKLTNNNVSEYIKNTDDEFKFEAVFEPITYTITLNTNNIGENGKLKGVTNMYYNDEKKESIIDNLRYNEKVKLEAIPNKGYVFKHWNLNGNKYLTYKTFIYNVERNSIFEAVFEPITYKVSIETYPKNAGILSQINSIYNYGDNIELTAAPNNGYKFKNWIIDGKNESSDNEYIYTPEFEYSKNIKIVANFQKTIFEEKLKLIKDLLENKIESSIILLDKSLLYDYIDSPNNKSNEIYYIKDDNTSNYVVRYDGKIKPTFVDNRNTIFYKDYIDENELGTSIYAKYGKLKYEPLYPSIDYCAIKNSSNIDYTYLPEDIYNNDYEYSWFNNSKCLMLNPEIKFEYNTKNSGYKNLDKVIEDKLKEYYNIEDNDNTKLNYIKNLYEYTNNLEYYSNDDINDYIYNITLTLKCK